MTRANRTHSSIGDAVGGGSRRARSAEYRRERARLDPFEAIARQVILRRGELGLTQKELAERVGTSHSAISRLESGQHRASIATLERVGEALGLRLVVSLEPTAA
jgi:ribosome-binding protein aMBF1 (putative translation factor)